ncbi:MAG: DNA (cytosine-5-)-methyltransferase [Chloroflexi bacterium]|nr:DNA (cytosine-5-)-methyltransferase [Chloroflexota bacterium]
MQSKLKAVSLFSGTGGFDWGAQQAGVEIIWANDIDPHAAKAYQSLFPNVEFVLGDICNVSHFPKADILIGCYPCTGFSVAARRRWKNLQERDLKANDNNFLYKEFLRALKDIKPKYLFVENVRGMTSADGGWFLDRQIQGFQEAGYKIWKGPLFAPDFGVAQARTRVFIVGIKKDEGIPDYISPIPEYGPKTSKPYLTIEDVIGNMEEWPDGEFFDYPFHGHYLTRNRKRGWHEQSFTIVANAHHVPLHPIGDPMIYISKDKWALQGDKNRRLSWKECAALQGLPETAIPNGTLMDKYRVIGNAVPPAFAKALIKPIFKFF